MSGLEHYITEAREAFRTTPKAHIHKVRIFSNIESRILVPQPDNMVETSEELM